MKIKDPWWAMNDLRRYFENNKGNLIHKWMHYFDIYERHFKRFRGTDVHILEIGVFHGGSLQMWKSYFGERAKIYGVDINPLCKQLEEEQIKIFIGDQASKTFLRWLIGEIPRIDILIDDGGHKMAQQINTFEVIYPHITPFGIYLCEDIHTSYSKEHGGGYRKRGSFIEYSKNLIDYLHAWHCEKIERLGVSDFTRSTYALHYYDSILLIEKRPIEKPCHRKTGKSILHSSSTPFPVPQWKIIMRRFKSLVR
jgi:hypothetical protein